MGKRYSTIVRFELSRFGFDGVVSQCCSPQVCVFTTFHVVISEKESVELFYKVRNGWNRSGLALGCSLAKLFKKSGKDFRVLYAKNEGVLFHETLYAKL